MSDKNNPKDNKDLNLLMKPTRPMVSASRFITIGQILSVISILLGGVILCSIALICSIVGYTRASRYLAQAPQNEITRWQIIRASGKFAIIMSSIILVVNLIILFYVMPYAFDVINSAGSSSFWGGATGSGQPGGTGGAFW